PEGARLARLAAELRVRLFRFDQVPTDAREAIELYAEAARLSAQAAEGCEAERRRALLAGVLARDAAAAYRELYLASRRQAAIAGAAGRRGQEGARSRCLTDFDLGLAQAIAYRPQGEAMRALERDGNATAEAALKGAPPAPFAPSVPRDGGAAAAVVPAGSSSGAPAAGPPSDNVVVSPAESAA